MIAPTWDEARHLREPTHPERYRRRLYARLGYVTISEDESALVLERSQ